jgi:hypothetical protein
LKAELLLLSRCPQPLLDELVFGVFELEPCQPLPVFLYVFPFAVAYLLPFAVCPTAALLYAPDAPYALPPFEVCTEPVVP